MQSGATVLSKLDRVRDEIGDLFPQSAMVRNRSIAVLLPCYNEAAAIAQTIADFRAALPEAAIYVYDNNSSDATCEIAAAAGAIVRSERMQGKGNVVRRMFADVDADIYVMADGDATYDATAAPALVAQVEKAHGPITCLVNNASRFEFDEPVGDRAARPRAARSRPSRSRPRSGRGPCAPRRSPPCAPR